jgi:hypothetical protein
MVLVVFMVVFAVMLMMVMLVVFVVVMNLWDRQTTDRIDATSSKFVAVDVVEAVATI